MASGPPAISVVGNQLEAGGVPVQLRGVNSDAYASCFGNAVYDATFAKAPDNDPDDDFAQGPVNQWSVAVMKSWGINTVRLAVNESCWLGEPTAADAASQQSPAPTECESYAPDACESAADYRQDVESYIRLLGANGLYVVLNLQVTAPPGYRAIGIDNFPDAEHAPLFWQQAAAAFGSDPNVLFDLSGEVAANQFVSPYYVAGSYDYTSADAGQHWSDSDIWNCWRNGCDDVPSTHGTSKAPVLYDTAGVDELIDAVRNTGATNPVIVGSPDFTHGYDEADCGPAPSPSSGSQDCWSEYTPVDPDGQMVVDAHLYDFDFFLPPTDSNGNADPTEPEEASALSDADAFVDNFLVPIAQTYPVMIGEMGETDCQDPDAPFVPGILAKVDQVAANDGLTFSLLAWTWEADDDDGNAVMTGWRCPTGSYGQGGPPLISDFDGTPTAMGQVVENWLLSKDQDAPPPPPAPLTAPVSATPEASTTSTAPAAGDQTESGTATPDARMGLHIALRGARLRCAGRPLGEEPRTELTYSWYRASGGKAIAGPERSAEINAAAAQGHAVYCRETADTSAGTVSATSQLLPVPGRLRVGHGRLRLTLICPSEPSGGCNVVLRLHIRGRHGRSLGRTRALLGDGEHHPEGVRLSSAGHRLLERKHRLRVVLTVTETVAGVTQTVAHLKLTLHQGQSERHRRSRTRLTGSATGHN